jgi:choice-of-anchor C domain-containing protein
MKGRVSRRMYWLCSAGALVLAGSAYGAAFTNGSFESASVAPGSFIQLNSGDTSITGWTVRPASIDYIGTYWVSEDGVRSLDLSGSAAGGIEQAFDTIPGSVYSVTFYLAGNPNSTCDAFPVKGLDVGATGNPTQHFTFDVTGHTTSSMGWELETYTFFAAGASTTLFFQSTTASGCGPALDNVSVTVVPPVPALSPATVATLALLVAVVAWFAVGRRSAT